MKKFSIVLLVAALMFSLVACAPADNKEKATEAPAAEKKQEEQKEEKPEEKPEEKKEEEPKADKEKEPAADAEMNIHLITMDQMDVHWVKLEKAAKAKVEELTGAGKKINYKWLAPEKKDNAQQIQMIETAINDGANVIIISCNDSTAANDVLKEALDKGIKLIYVDSPATVEASATFATDNFAAGEAAGKKLLEELEAAEIKEGKIGIISAQAGVQSCIDRVDGFIKAFDGTPYELGEVQYSDGDAAKAQDQAAALINDGVIALYGANDGATNGMANAVKEANANGKNVLAVGFDNSSSNRAHVKDGELLAFMAQNPNVMGEKSIEAAVKVLEGEKLEETQVDTGVTVVTKDNVDQFED